MSKNESPIFGENGAVLNNETMTDEWRAEHDAQASRWRNSPFWTFIFICCLMALVDYPPQQFIPIALAIVGAIEIIRSFVPEKDQISPPK